MQTRSQFLNGLTTLTKLPVGVDDECLVCLEELIDGVELPCGHYYHKECITEWLSRRSRTTCPTCRSVLVDDSCDLDRGPAGTDRLQIVAHALELSGLTTEDRFDVYSDETYYTLPAIHRAAANAHQYLAEESHSRVTGPVLINIHVLGPQLIAMGNLLRGYARATRRSYSGYQRRDWKLIVGHLHRHLDLAHGHVREGDSVIGMARDFGARVRESLRKDGIDLNSGRFFERGARLQSPSGDLDVLLKYMVFQCAKAYQDREAQRAALRRAQKEALDRETTRVGWAFRKAAQKVFGTV